MKYCSLRAQRSQIITSQLDQFKVMMSKVTMEFAILIYNHRKLSFNQWTTVKQSTYQSLRIPSLSSFKNRNRFSKMSRAEMIEEVTLLLHMLHQLVEMSLPIFNHLRITQVRGIKIWALPFPLLSNELILIKARKRLGSIKVVWIRLLRSRIKNRSNLKI